MTDRDISEILFIPIPVNVAKLLVELVEDMGDLTPAEAEAVGDARDLIDWMVVRYHRVSES